MLCAYCWVQLACQEERTGRAVSTRNPQSSAVDDCRISRSTAHGSGIAMCGTRALQLLPAQSATSTRQATWPRRRLRTPACRQLCRAACRPLLRRTCQLLRGLPQRQAHPRCRLRTISCSCHTRSCRRHRSQAAAQPALVQELLAFWLRRARRPPRSLQREWATPVSRRLVSSLWAHVRA